MQELRGFYSTARQTHIAAGSAHTVVLKNYEVYTCGLGRSGQLGIGEVDHQLLPIHVQLP
jgi:alpha-tubulin suppressor-like RCC1 family protein